MNHSTAMASFTRKNQIMVFDVETTGLLPKAGSSLDESPYITQLSFVIYDCHKHSIVFVFNSYIILPEHVEVPVRITEITGITKSICQTKGIPIQDALRLFYQWYRVCSRVVAHNISFDIQLIRFEIQRHHLDMDDCPGIVWIFREEDVPIPSSACLLDFLHLPDWVQSPNTKQCSMRLGKDTCNLYVSSKFPNAKGEITKYKKFPKLNELYETLFHNVPINLHNSLTDTLVCLRCFVKLWFQYEIPLEELHLYGMIENRRFSLRQRGISPPPEKENTPLPIPVLSQTVVL
jgi:DNA polymerase III epsilon subunit-like protein